MATNELLTDEVAISWDQKKGKRFLKFLFQGSFTEAQAEPAIHKWKQEFETLASDEKIDLIWNCLEMTKYSAGAAKLWKNAMSVLNPKIDQIWLVSSNTFIKMGAKTVTFLLPINLKVVASEYEIQ